MKSIISSLLPLLLLFSVSTAFAQEKKSVTNDSLGVTVTAPENWEVTQNSDKAVANFKKVGSQSQIEVVGTKLMTSDVADVFFTTFHKTLTESDFKEVSSTEKKVGTRAGKETTYTFEHSGVKLNVVVFQFLAESTAWLVVGYVPDGEMSAFGGDFTAVIESVKLKG